jgi:hypothetical protein
MKNTVKNIFTIIICIFHSNTYSQNIANKFCFKYIDKYEVKTEIEIEIKSDSTYKMKSISYSSPKYGEIKKIESEDKGRIICSNKKLYLKSINDSLKLSYPIKLNKRRLIIFAYKKEKKLLSQEYEYKLSKGIIFLRNRSPKIEK